MSAFETMNIERLVSSLALPCEHQDENTKHESLQSGWVIDCFPVTKELYGYCTQLRKAMPSLRFGVDRDVLEIAQTQKTHTSFSKCYVYRADDLYVMGAIGFGMLGNAAEDKYLTKSQHIENNMFCEWSRAHKCKATKNIRPAVANALTYFRRPSDRHVLDATYRAYTGRVNAFLEQERNVLASKMSELYKELTGLMFGKAWEKENDSQYMFQSVLGSYRTKPHLCRPVSSEMFGDVPLVKAINDLANSYFKLADTKTDVSLVHPVKDVNNVLVGYNITKLVEQQTRNTLSELEPDIYQKNLVVSECVDQEIASKVATLSMLEEKEYSAGLGLKLAGDIYYVETNVEALPDDYYDRQGES